MNKPSWRGHLGVRTLAVMVAVLVVGIVLIVIGGATSAGSVRGVGVLLAILGLVAIAGLIVRWIVYRGVG